LTEFKPGVDEAIEDLAAALKSLVSVGDALAAAQSKVVELQFYVDAESRRVRLCRESLMAAIDARIEAMR
jgi:hypothetical protein